MREDNLLFGVFAPGFEGTFLVEHLTRNVGHWQDKEALRKLVPNVDLGGRLRKIQRAGSKGTGPKKRQSSQPWHLEFSPEGRKVRLLFD